jgi:hypothetical protein
LLSLVSALWFDENTAKGSQGPNNANCPEFCKQEAARLAFLRTNSKFDGKIPQKILGSERQKHGRNIQRQKHSPRNFANKTITKSFYVSLVHFSTRAADTTGE